METGVVLEGDSFLTLSLSGRSCVGKKSRGRATEFMTDFGICPDQIRKA
jgi:hypothetical protein